jgi:cell division protease FtsH
MVTEYGMSEKLGLVTYSRERRPLFLETGVGGSSREYSDETARAIDAEVTRLMNEAHDRVTKILSDKREQLELLTQTLLTKETVLGDEVRELVGMKAAAVQATQG